MSSRRHGIAVGAAAAIAIAVGVALTSAATPGTAGHPTSAIGTIAPTTGTAVDNLRTRAVAATLPRRAQVLAGLRRAGNYWIATHPDPGANNWREAVMLHGYLTAHATVGDALFINYARRWAGNNAFGLHGGPLTHNPDDQVSGRVYLDLDGDRPNSVDLSQIMSSVDEMVRNGADNEWWWVDALYMGMPVFAQLGVVENEPSFVDKAYAMYHNTKSVRGLYSKTAHLWSRDQRHRGVFWSRGNGWAFAALADVLTALPGNTAHRADYRTTFQQMAAALAAAQRPDGFWNTDLGDPSHFGGPESSGTSLFTYGLAWGIRHGVLSRAKYLPVLIKAWHALSTVALHSNGLVGYVQPEGGTPAPSTPNHTADYGVGVFLLAASAVAELAPQ